MPREALVPTHFVRCRRTYPLKISGCLVHSHYPGDDLKKDKERNKELATYRYSDKAIFNFVDEMKKRYPQSLFIITGDHSNLFGNLRNTSLIHRDYTLRDTYQTVCLFQHPQIHKDFFTAVRGSHMSIMPTIIEAIAPKGFTYY